MMFSIKCFHKDVPSLVKSTEDLVIEAEATALFDAGTDSNFEVLSQVDKS